LTNNPGANPLQGRRSSLKNVSKGRGGSKQAMTKDSRRSSSYGDESMSYKQWTKNHQDVIEETTYSEDEDFGKTKKTNGRKITSSIANRTEKLPNVNNNKHNFSGVSEFSSRSNVQSGMSKKRKGGNGMSKEDRAANKSVDHVPGPYSSHGSILNSPPRGESEYKNKRVQDPKENYYKETLPK
jgi:hypothetical protein